MIDFENVLDFWFADSIASIDAFSERSKVWFTTSAEFDGVIKEKFEALIEPAARQSQDCLSENPREILASIILLDQFPRNVYRGTPKAFAYDACALALTRKLIDTGLDETFHFVERVFVYMPLQHSEESEVQELSVEMFAKLEEAADNEVYAESAAESVEYAALHKDIIDQFGRFPHRNEILGRESTQAEIAYMQAGAETFGQVKKE